MKTGSSLLILTLVLALKPYSMAKMTVRRPMGMTHRNTRAKPAARHTNSAPSTSSSPVSTPAETSSGVAPGTIPPRANPYLSPGTAEIGGSSQMTNQIPIIIPEVRTNRPPAKASPPASTEKAVIVAHYDETDPILQFQMQNARKGDSRSQYALGMRYLEGIGVERNEFLAREYLEQSSSLGDRRATEKLRELNR